MTKLTLFSEAEVAESSDFEAISRNARAADEQIVGGAIAWPNGWSRFTISTPSSDRVRISTGSLWVDQIVYTLDAPVEIDLTQHIPLIVGDERYIAILASGLTEELKEQRFIETDVDSGTTVLTPTPKTERRTIEFRVQQGLSSPTPLRPVVAGTNCCVGYVRLASTGIVAVESAQPWRVKTLFEIEGRLVALEAQVPLIIQRTVTLETDLANLQALFKDFPRREVIQQLQRDNARVRRILNLPDEARAYFYDAGLVKDQWAIDNALWEARVEEGIRFQWSSERDERLEVINPAQTGIRIQNDVLMPAWTEKAKIEVDGSGGTKNISQQVHTVTTAVKREVARSSVSYGPTVAMCDNVAEWAQIGTAREGQTFQANGETFQKIGLIDASYAGQNIDTSIFNQVHGSTYTANDVIVHNSQVGETGWRNIYAAQSIQVSSWTEVYWDYVTETFGINGSVYGQTFLLTQPMVLTSIDLKFDRVDTDGDVTLVLCEVSNTGSPLFQRVVARSTLTAAQITKGWTKFNFVPRYLDPGRRYAWVTVTTGNYSLNTVTGAKYAEGTLFWSTDQAWFQGSPEEDFCFRVNGAEFSVNRVVVDFDPLELENGMTEIKLLYGGWCPDGTSMMWEVKPSGKDTWEPLRPETAEHPNPLRGLPALCSLRLTMIGTSGLAPAIVLDTKARSMARRPRGTARAVTKILNFGFATTKIDVELSVDQFDDLLHDVDPKIIVGSTTYTPTVQSMSRDVSKASRRLITASFTVPSTTSARLQIDQTTTTVQSVCFIENASLYAK